MRSYQTSVTGGHLSHDDKDYILWRRSKGTLTTNDQQFEPGIRAPQFNPAKKVVIEVQGFKYSIAQNNALSKYTRKNSSNSNHSPPRETEAAG